MLTAGVPEAIAHSEKAISFLCAYCTDMDTPASGEIKLSQYTQKKLSQLSLLKEDSVKITKYGVLLVNFDCKDDISVTLNILQNNEIKFTYKIDRAVVEILETGDYTIELIAPDGYVDVESVDVSILENKSVEVYKEIVKIEAEEDKKVDVIFSCKNDYNQNIPGLVFEFKNRTTNEVIGNFTSTNEDQTISLTPGYYAITPVAAPNGYSTSTNYYTVNATKENNIKITTNIGKTITAGSYGYMNGQSLSSGYIPVYGLEEYTRGTLKMIKDLDKEVVTTMSLSRETATATSLTLSGRYNTADYTLNFEPDSDLMLPTSFVKNISDTGTKLVDFRTKDGYGAVIIQVRYGSSLHSNSNSKDLITYSVTFTNVETGEQFIREYEAKYKVTGLSTYSIAQGNIEVLPAGEYTFVASDVQGETNYYRYSSGTQTLTITNGGLAYKQVAFTK